jgi:hypothetical protein
MQELATAEPAAAELIHRDAGAELYRQMWAVRLTLAML